MLRQAYYFLKDIQKNYYINTINSLEPKLTLTPTNALRFSSEDDALSALEKAKGMAPFHFQPVMELIVLRD